MLNIALVADPHYSMLDKRHCEIELGQTAPLCEALVEDINRRQPDYTIWMGDLIHESVDEVRSRFAGCVRRLSVPSLFFSGNHDVEMIGKADFARQTVPCLRRLWWQAEGWDIAIIDTVEESAVPGCLCRGDRLFIREVLDQAEGPVLVMGHHPFLGRRGILSAEDSGRFEEDLREFNGSFSGVGVYIGAHTHKNIVSVHENWHRLEIASCSSWPFNYHWLELSPQGLAVKTVDLRDTGLVKPEGLPQPTAPVYPLTVASA